MKLNSNDLEIIGDQVMYQVWSQVSWQIWSQVSNQVLNQVMRVKLSLLSNYLNL